MRHEPGMRLDKWLWFARLAPSRSAAKQLCSGCHLRLDGRVIDRSCAIVRPGAVLAFPKGGQVLAVRVEALGERRGPATEARMLYTLLLDTGRPGAPPDASLAAPSSFARPVDCGHHDRPLTAPHGAR